MRDFKSSVLFVIFSLSVAIGVYVFDFFVSRNLANIWVFLLFVHILCYHLSQLFYSSNQVVKYLKYIVCYIFKIRNSVSSKCRSCFQLAIVDIFNGEISSPDISCIHSELRNKIF